MYVEILTDGLRRRGFNIIRINNFFSNLFEVKIIHLNWYENIIGIIDFLKKTIKLTIFVLSGKKIIWTIHNKKPHESQYYHLQKIFTRILTYSASSIVIHSHDSRILFEKFSNSVKSKIIYIPHPNYIGVYGDSINGSNDDLMDQNTLKLLFFGFVRPYKNLELLIECVQNLGNNIELTIAGKPKDEGYAKILREISNNCDNIKLDLQFIEDRNLIKYISSNDLVVLPYHMDSVLNSGAIFLSFSYGRSVICPAIGTINDIDNKDFIVNYSYSDEDNHRQVLNNALKRAVELKKQNVKIFEIWGNTMKNYVSKRHNKEMVIDELKTLYMSYLNR